MISWMRLQRSLAQVPKLIDQIVDDIKMVKNFVSKAHRPTSSVSYAQFHERISPHIVKVDSYSFWHNTNYSFALDDFCSSFGKYEYAKEKRLHEYLVDEFNRAYNKMVKKPLLAIVDTSQRPFLDAESHQYVPDWVIHDDNKPLDPTWFIVVGDTKVEGSNFPTPADSGQVLYYAEFTLKNSFHLSIDAFLTSGKHICFWRVTKNDHGEFTYLRNGPHLLSFQTKKEKTIGFDLLMAMLRGPATHINIPDVPQPILDTLKYKTSGLSSFVYTAMMGPMDVIVKVYKKQSDQTREVTVLKELTGPRVPTIKAEGSNWIIISPAGKVVDSTTKFNIFPMILDTIISAHKKGIIHRDIRPSNIIIYVGPILIVWSSSISDTLSPTPYEGTIYTASNRVLQYLADDKFNILSTKADDLESFVKTLIILTFGQTFTNIISAPITDT
ncbi:hypothetical protein SAMD00019534_086530 [Acytostelium subglobosum LB1]|uniref:hypothetical protein n=1 Tax=Acytostelium subglobosum LB1 TaxID=1410327 RepID=UPI000644FA2E|nr:hypothetical protein SAMD00019534_086530 [Acytostelium subglobosum LB1]GAM25478.1 hypothetical protein SAMD00019534_086530 [Acytostelium subglobosum LB1]|eukprot:XP_012751464.1 hypothetical protein SAMD00019534_086530 [Acytostelium subglobosum LB1]